MQQTALGGTGRMTTRLGFGCSSVMGGLNRRESLAMLEAAFDAGITHFDVAPSYGYGQAEACLGEFLARHAGRLTVTTKYGIPPAKNQSLIGLARGIVRPIIRQIPSLKKRIAGVAGSVVQNQTAASFTAGEARRSLEGSLAALRVGCVDVWLLHEATAESLHDNALLRFLEEAVAAGKVGTFGVGSERAKIASLLASRPEYCRVLQYEWSVLDATIAEAAPARIHHRSLTDNFRSLHTSLLGKPEVCARWSKATGQDLSKADLLAGLMLKASLVANPASVILFSSKSPAHIRANVCVAEDAALEEPARRLHELVLSDGKQILPGVN